MATNNPFFSFTIPGNEELSFSDTCIVPLERLVETLQQGSALLFLSADATVSPEWLTAERIDTHVRRSLMEAAETRVWRLYANSWAISVQGEMDLSDPLNALPIHALHHALIKSLEAEWRADHLQNAPQLLLEAVNDAAEIAEMVGERKGEAKPPLVLLEAAEAASPLPDSLFTLTPVAKMPLLDDMQGNIAELNSLLEIILKKQLHSQFQPIVNLRDGSILGYEALIRGPKGALLRRPGQMFRAADKARMVAWFDIACAEQCIARAAGQGIKHLLFVNMDAEGLDYLETQERTLGQCAREHGLSPSQIVIEVTERQTVDDFPRLLQAIEKLREEGFKIAVDDVGAGYSSLNAIAELRPEFMKIDHALVRNIDVNGARRALLSALMQYARHIGTAVLAEGAETRPELATLIDMGIPYGQGYLMGRPNDDFRGVPRETREFMRERANQRRLSMTGRHVTVGALAKAGLSVTPETPLAFIAKKFAKDLSLTSVVVIEDNCAIGLVMRDQLSYVLDMVSAAHVGEMLPDQTVAQWMTTGVLFASEQASVIEIARQATSRPDISLEKDIVVVGESNRYVGVLSARALMEAATGIQESQLRYASPLTGLPGVVVLDQTLRERLEHRTPIVVIRTDIVGLDAFNRLYGLASGDSVIKAMARLVRDVSEACGRPDDFLAHLGGDDFILLTDPEVTDAVCRALIQGFNKIVSQVYTPEHLRQGYVASKDNYGNLAQIPLLTLAVAAQTNRKRRLTHYGQIGEYLTDLLRFVMIHPGSHYTIDRCPVKS